MSQVDVILLLEYSFHYIGIRLPIQVDDVASSTKLFPDVLCMTSYIVPC